MQAGPCKPGVIYFVCMVLIPAAQQGHGWRHGIDRRQAAWQIEAINQSDQEATYKISPNHARSNL